MRALLIFAAVALSAPAAAGQDGDQIDLFLARLAARTLPRGGPGCTFGVSQHGTNVTAGYGFADLERRVPLTPTSILEAGSVSKQFTAAAVLLLALDGKLTLDDDVRSVFPELPNYGTRITVRHLLTHTSGLRDWGAIASLEGWPRGTREHSNAHVLDIASRQRALNHPPGAAYSYTNTGYNLLALLVERVSGRTFAEFTRDRLFLPLGMSNTSWRDDHRRVLPGRALAYSPRGDAYETNMPNEDAHGNGGLLTTALDLLKWNDAMNRAALGAAFADSSVRRFTLVNGRTIDYAMGIFVRERSGLREISHSGSTAGYGAYLLRYPGAGLSVAVLCNAGGAVNATLLANEIADSLLVRPAANAGRGGARPGAAAAAGATPPGPAVAGADPAPYAGIWVHTERHTSITLSAVDGQLRRGNTTLRPLAPGAFADGGGRMEFSNVRAGRAMAARAISPQSDTVTFRRGEPWTPDAVALRAFEGVYASDEVHGEPFRVAVNQAGRLELRQGPVSRRVLTPEYRDAFTGGGLVVWFARDAAGRVTTMHTGQARAWDVAFRRTATR